MTEQQRRGVLAGIRWSIWVSSLAIPFGIGTKLLLARLGPEVIGVYGLLGLYLAMTTCFVYFGGDNVVMRFIPGCDRQDRASFLLSYLLFITAILCVWLVVAWRLPIIIRWLLGSAGGDHFHLLVLGLAPLPIVFMMAVATLKAMLDARYAQILKKLPTILALVAYTVVIVIARTAALERPFLIVWGVYLGLLAVFGIVGVIRVFRVCGAPQLRFHLPSGFWSYAIAIEQLSAIGFFAHSLDDLLILHHGGLTLLGRYVALMSVVAIIPMTSAFFMDTLFPSLTNLLALNNRRGAGQVFMLHMRTIFPVTVGLTCAVVLFAVPATEILGPKYYSLARLIVLAAAFQGLANPGGYGSTLLASVDRQQIAVGTTIFQIALFTVGFIIAWPHWRLAGAVVAYGVALVVSRAALLWLATKVAVFYPPIFGLWIKAAVIELAVCGIALVAVPLGLWGAVIVWLVAMGTFLAIARYTRSETAMLLDMLRPGFQRSSSSGADASAPRQ